MCSQASMASQCTARAMTQLHTCTWYFEAKSMCSRGMAGVAAHVNKAGLEWELAGSAPQRTCMIWHAASASASAEHRIKTDTSFATAADLISLNWLANSSTPSSTIPLYE